MNGLSLSQGPDAISRAVEKRIEIDPNSGCWLWTGALINGYAGITIDGRQVRVSRLLLGLHERPEEHPKLLACHRCDTPACVNLAHLFVGTHADNNQDMARKGRHWAQVHPERTRISEFKAHAWGEAHPSTKMSNATVLLIWRRLGERIPLTEIAAEFGITRTHVTLIRDRKTRTDFTKDLPDHGWAPLTSNRWAA